MVFGVCRYLTNVPYNDVWCLSLFLVTSITYLLMMFGVVIICLTHLLMIFRCCHYLVNIPSYDY